MTMNSIQPMLWYRKPIFAILSYVCIVTTLLVVVYKPWSVIKATPQTRASPTALIDDNSIITSEHNQPLPELPVVEEGEQVIVTDDLLPLLPAKQSAVIKKAKPVSKKKRNWLRFASPAR